MSQAVPHPACVLWHLLLLNYCLLGVTALHAAFWGEAITFPGHAPNEEQ